jgi:HEAT repeat protein
VARLRLLAGSGVADARLAAVRILGELRDLDSSETLIAALADDDWRVVVAADESLRLIGRAVSPSPLGEKPDDKARSAAAQRWKQWYVTIRPDAQFEN